MEVVAAAAVVVASAVSAVSAEELLTLEEVLFTLTWVAVVVVAGVDEQEVDGVMTGTTTTGVMAAGGGINNDESQGLARRRRCAVRKVAILLKAVRKFGSPWSSSSSLLGVSVMVILFFVSWSSALESEVVSPSHAEGLQVLSFPGEGVELATEG